MSKRMMKQPARARKPSEFWKGRVVTIAALHLMLLGVAAILEQTDFDDPTLSEVAGRVYALLSLPLIAPFKTWGVGDWLAHLPFGLPSLIALAIYAANSFVWGFAIDGYLRIVSGLLRRMRG